MRAQPPPTGGKSTSALGKRSCPPDGAQLAGMKADDGLNLRANGHSGFFPCPDALNGNRIILTPPQGWLGSRGRQPLRRERAASSHSFPRPRRGGEAAQSRTPPTPPAPAERSGQPRPTGKGSRVDTPCSHSATRLPRKAPPRVGFYFGGVCNVG